MTIHRIGTHRDLVPARVLESFERGADESNHGNFYYNESTGMEYGIHEVDGEVWLEACHEDVGLVTWYRADTVDEVWAEITAERSEAGS